MASYKCPNCDLELDYEDFFDFKKNCEKFIRLNEIVECELR